jgi:hypothetical protein
MINKTWTLSVFTPFGIEEHSMLLTQTIPFVCGKIFSNKGEMTFQTGTIIGDEIFIESTMDYPISCTVKIQGKITENSIDGHVFIDDYLRVPFKGEF